MKRKYELYLFDVWGNAKDGFEVNNWHKALISKDGSIFNIETIIIEIADSATDYQINRSLGCKGIVWDGSCFPDINGSNKRNGKPFGFLRLINEDNKS